MFAARLCGVIYLFLKPKQYGPDSDEEDYTPSPEDLAYDVLDEVFDEFKRATNLHDPLNSSHEALAVLEEETYELMLEVYSNERKNPERLANMRAEAIQVAAMAVRFVVDVCDKPKEIQQ